MQLEGCDFESDPSYCVVTLDKLFPLIVCEEGNGRPPNSLLGDITIGPHHHHCRSHRPRCPHHHYKTRS